MSSNEQNLRRNDIVAAVASLIADQGLETLTMRNIAKHLGCSVGTLPHYFDSKEDIVIAALNWSNERIFTRLENFVELGTLSENYQLQDLYPLISSSMPMDQQSDTEWRVRLCLWDYAVTNDEMRQSVNQISDTAKNTLKALVEHLQKNNEITHDMDAESIAMMLYHMCIGAGFNMLHHDFDERVDILAPLFNFIENIRTDI